MKTITLKTEIDLMDFEYTIQKEFPELLGSIPQSGAADIYVDEIYDSYHFDFDMGIVKQELKEYGIDDDSKNMADDESIIKCFLWIKIIDATEQMEQENE